MANRTLILFASAWLLCAGCGPHQEPGPAILARVGTQTVSIEDFTAAWNRRVGLEDTPANRAAVLQVVITRKAMVEAALRAGFDRDPEVRHQYEASLIGHLREAELEPKLRSATVEPVELEQYYHNHSSSHTQHGSLHLAALVLEADPQTDRATGRLPPGLADRPGKGSRLAANRARIRSAGHPEFTAFGFPLRRRRPGMAGPGRQIR